MSLIIVLDYTILKDFNVKTMRLHRQTKESQNAAIQFAKLDCVLKAAHLIQTLLLIASLPAYKNVGFPLA
jgi:hypothetical protein